MNYTLTSATILLILITDPVGNIPIFIKSLRHVSRERRTLVIVREDLLGHALKACPSAFNYKTVADNGSMYNTPPTYSIYMAGLTFQWLKRQGGVAAMEQRNIAKAQLLYDYLDSSSFYSNKVAHDYRSRMNVTAARKSSISPRRALR